MPRVWSIINRRSDQRVAGFSLAEVLLAVAVFGVIVAGLGGALIYGRASADNANDRQLAMMLADEGIDAARNIGGAAYTNLVDSTYGLSKSGGTWAFSGSSDVNGIYTRQVSVATAAANRKTITSTVTWPQAGSTTGSVTVISQLMNWAAAIKSWANAIQVGSTAATGATGGLRIAVQGKYAYMVRSISGSNNFIVIDISTPSAPAVVATKSFANTPTYVAVSGNYAYVTTSSTSAALQVIDITTPTNPTLVKTLTYSAGTSTSRAVTINGNYAYLIRGNDSTTGANEFNVVDVTTPASATIVGGYNNNIAMSEIYASGNFAYVATTSTSQEMLVINVTTPTAPALAATYNPATTLTALSITGYGNTVLLGMSTTLDAINITTPTAPVRLGTFTAAGTINDIDTDATHQYALVGTASTTGEFQVVNIGTPASMTLAKTLDVTGTTSSITGVAYSSTYDIAVTASASTTLQEITFAPN